MCGGVHTWYSCGYAYGYETPRAIIDLFDHIFAGWWENGVSKSFCVMTPLFVFVVSGFSFSGRHPPPTTQKGRRKCPQRSQTTHTRQPQLNTLSIDLCLSLPSSTIMLTSLALCKVSRPLLRSSVACKAFFGSMPPASDPLALIRDECHKRKLCDEFGFRRPGVHWVFSVAVTPDDVSQVCILFITVMVNMSCQV